MKKIWLPILLALLLYASAFPSVTHADDTVYSEGYFYYTINDQSVTIVGYFGNETEVTVPSSIAGYPVNAIAPGAFANTTVKVLHLPDTIRAVGEGGTGEADVSFMGEKPVEAPTTDTENPQGTNPMTAPVPTENSIEGVMGQEPSAKTPEPANVPITPEPTAVPTNETQPTETPTPKVTEKETKEPTKAPKGSPAQSSVDLEKCNPTQTTESESSIDVKDLPKDTKWVGVVLLSIAILACGAVFLGIRWRKANR